MSLGFESGAWLSMNVLLLQTTRIGCFLLPTLNTTSTVAI